MAGEGFPDLSPPNGGEMFLAPNLHFTLEDQVRASLEEAVQKQWLTPEEAEAQFLTWQNQYPDLGALQTDSSAV